MRMAARIGLALGAFTPQPRHLVGHPAHRFCVFVPGAKVPGLCITRTIPIQAFGQREVAAQRLQHMLPRAHRVGVTDVCRLASFKSRQDVGDQAVCRPVAAANHIAGPCGGQRHTVLCVGVNAEV